MRITGGTNSGQTITAPKGRTTRPTSDRVRAALFNILMHHDWGEAAPSGLEGRLVLDAFAGSGALSFEALSRGSFKAYAFETDREAQKCLSQNTTKLGYEKNFQLLRQDATRPPAALAACDLIFLDPPYHKELIPLTLTALTKTGWLAPQALIVAETAKKETLSLPPTYQTHLERVYGDTCLHFLSPLTQSLSERKN